MDNRDDHAPAPAHVLLVEDDADSGEWMVLALESEGYRLEWLRDGAAALERLRHKDAVSPDLILLDLTLPGEDGVELMRDLMLHEVALPPVIILSARSHVSVDVAAGFMGAAAVLRKPFQLEQLLLAVRSILNS